MVYKYLYSKRGPNKEILVKGVFVPKLLNNPIASYALKNFDFLLSHTAHFDKSIIVPFFVLKILYFYFLNFKQYNDTVL